MGNQNNDAGALEKLSSVLLLWDEARELLRRGNTAGAIQTLGIAYAYAPGNILLAVRYGQLLSSAGRHAEGIEVLERAVQLVDEIQGPAFILHRELGMAYKRAGQTENALRFLTKAVAENPHDSDAYGIIGGIYKDDLEPSKALESYERGFEADPHSTYCLLNILCLLEWPEIKEHDKGKREDELLPVADRLTSQAMNAPSPDHWAMYDRALYLLFDGQAAEAKALFAKAIESTNTIGDLKSARKNLDLLYQCSALVGLNSHKSIIPLFAAAEARLAAL